MFAIMLVASAIAASGPSGDAASSQESVIGRWELTPESATLVPKECGGLAYSFTETTLTGESGSLRMVTTYRTEQRGELIVVRQSELRHNGQPNCQGRTAEHVAERFVMDLEVEVVEGRLRVYMFKKLDGDYLEFARASVRPN